MEVWLLSCLTSTQDEGKWSASDPGRLIAKKELRYPISTWLVDCRPELDVLEKR